MRWSAPRRYRPKRIRAILDLPGVAGPDHPEPATARYVHDGDWLQGSRHEPSIYSRIDLAQKQRPVDEDQRVAAEFGRFFRSLGRVARAIRMRAGAGKLAAVDDEVFGPDRPLLEPAFEESLACRPRSGSARKSRSRKYAASCRGGAWCATVVLCAQLRGTRRLRRSLRVVPNSRARTTASRSQSLPRAVFTRYAPRLKSLSVLSLIMCSVSGWRGQFSVTTSQTCTSPRASRASQIELLLDRFGQAVTIGVMEMHVERLEPAQHCEADAARRHRPDIIPSTS